MSSGGWALRQSALCAVTPRVTVTRPAAGALSVLRRAEAPLSRPGPPTSLAGAATDCGPVLLPAARKS